MATVLTFDAKYQADFARLNFAWIEQYFKVEAADEKYLLHPYETIIVPGGEIFFVLDQAQVVGTCALLKLADAEFELVKMAVDKNAQGKGFANDLMQAALDWARTKNARRILLESNRVLTAALQLYQKFGFQEIPLPRHVDSEYARVDIVMELRLR